MLNYIIRRLLAFIPTIIVTSILAFVLVNFVPGDIIDAMQSPSDIDVDREELERALGLDAPVTVQYLRWLGVMPQPDGKLRGIFQGHLGISWWRNEPVVSMIGRALPVTVELVILALVVAQSIALVIGILSAVRQDRFVDYVGRSLAIVCISVPGFWLGTMAIVFPAIWWGYTPPLIVIPFGDNPLAHLGMFIVPALLMGMASAGSSMRMTRTMMLEVLKQDYIRTAWAKGLEERAVVARHAVKNAMIPIVTIIGIQVPSMVAGAVIMEKIFSLPGMGRLIMDAIVVRDQPLIAGILFLFAIGLVVINLVVDLIYCYLDPRIHYA